jgi:hypothetical protein
MIVLLSNDQKLLISNLAALHLEHCPMRRAFVPAIARLERGSRPTLSL